MNRKLICAVFGALGLTGGIALAAEYVYVNRATLDVREGKGAAFATVATVSKGAKLEVIGREGKWLKVRAGDSEGYVFETSVSDKPTGGGGGLGALVGGPNASEMSAGAAAKGLEPQAEQYAQTKNLDRAPLNRMIQMRKSISGAEWEKFASEGKVGPAKP